MAQRSALLVHSWAIHASARATPGSAGPPGYGEPVPCMQTMLPTGSRVPQDGPSSQHAARHTCSVTSCLPSTGTVNLLPGTAWCGARVALRGALPATSSHLFPTILDSPLLADRRVIATLLA